ncbi:hypothetical protein J6590_027582 [Homalodisca vitripennis]|nr:hypothetical protein J6590_027580 [Homalodisca vitripennis]KAG8263648.1 hypothetical protein J6590_027582 [Homalodisca vitripennis]
MGKYFMHRQSIPLLRGTQLLFGLLQEDAYLSLQNATTESNPQLRNNEIIFNCLQKENVWSMLSCFASSWENSEFTQLNRPYHTRRSWLSATPALMSLGSGLHSPQVETVINLLKKLERRIGIDRKDASLGVDLAARNVAK